MAIISVGLFVLFLRLIMGTLSNKAKVEVTPLPSRTVPNEEQISVLDCPNAKQEETDGTEEAR